MKLSAPKQITFLIAVILLILGVLARFVAIPFVTVYAFWIVVVAAVLLVLGCAISGF